MKETLVALNIIIDNNVINRVPYLFYCNGLKEFKDDLKNSEEFKNFLIKKIKTIYEYSSGQVAYFFFKYDNDGEEFYVEETLTIESLFPINIIGGNIVNDLIDNIFTDLYIKVIDNQPDTLFNDLESKINFILKQIRTKYSEKQVSFNTIINYVKSKLINDYKLEKNNINYILTIITNILTK